MLHPRDARFVGHGNARVADGRYLGWRVECGKCGTSKIVASHSDRVLPPSVIVKKLTQAGWYIGRRPADDVCRECRLRARTKFKKGPEPLSHYDAVAVASGPVGLGMKRLRTLLVAGNTAAALALVDTMLNLRTEEPEQQQGGFESWLDSLDQPTS